LVGEAISKHYHERVAKLRQTIFEKYSLTQEVMQAALMQYQNKPDFAQRMEELTDLQKERFVELKIAGVE